MYDIFDIFNNSEFFQIPTQYKEVAKCPTCGMTYSDFRRGGKLGCSDCYKAFKAPLENVLRQIHQNPTHSGKVPKSMRAKITKQRKLEMLRAELQTAVKNEDYEKAAKLHKEILEIEKG